MAGWREPIGSTNYPGYKPMEMDAKQRMYQGYSNPQFSGFAPVGAGARIAPGRIGVQGNFTAPGAFNTQAFGRVAQADYGAMARQIGQQQAAQIQPNPFEAGILAKGGLRWNSGTGQAERIGVRQPMMAARPGVQAPAMPQSPLATRREVSSAFTPPIMQAAMGQIGSAATESLARSAAPRPGVGMPGVRMPVAAPRPGVQGPAMPDPRAQYMAAMQQMAGRYGPAVARAAGLEAGMAFDDQRRQEAMQQQEMAVRQKELEIRNQVAAADLLKAQQEPPPAQAFAAQMLANGNATDVNKVMGIAGQLFGGGQPQANPPTIPGQGVATPPPTSIPMSPMSQLAGHKSGIYDALQGGLKQGMTADDALARILDSGINVGEPGVASGLKDYLLSNFGQQAINQATASPYGEPMIPISGLGQDISTLPRWLRIPMQLINKPFGGPGTSMLGDPNEQVNQRQRAIALWKQISGQAMP